MRGNTWGGGRPPMHWDRSSWRSTEEGSKLRWNQQYLTTQYDITIDLFLYQGVLS